MPATRAYHVSGPCLISVGADQAPESALQPLGICQDGVDIQVASLWEPVKSDVAGPQMMAEVQQMGLSATIRAAGLVDYDDAVLSSLRNKTNHAAGADGELGDIGRLAGTSGDLYRVVLSSADRPWRFFFCYMRSPQSTKLSTKVTAWALTWDAFVFVPAGTNSAKGLKLFDHSAV